MGDFLRVVGPAAALRVQKMNWKQQIETQIAECTHHAESEYDEMHYLATLLQLLLDVAVAAEQHIAQGQSKGVTRNEWHSFRILSDALDKLREGEK